MPGVRDVSAAAFISAYASHLKRSGKLPFWSHARIVHEEQETGLERGKGGKHIVFMLFVKLALCGPKGLDSFIITMCNRSSIATSIQRRRQRFSRL